MPHLDRESLALHWRGKDGKLARLLFAMDMTEDWTFDSSDDVNAQIQNLGIKLSKMKSPSAILALDSDNLLFFMAYLSTSRALRLAEWGDATLGITHSIIETAKKVVTGEIDLDQEGSGMAPEDAKLARIVSRVFLDRLIILDRLNLQSAIFSSKTVLMLTKAVEEIQQN